MRTAPTSDDRVGEVLARGPGDGPATWAMGSLFERLASAAETDGAFGVSLVTQPPGVATPLHIHMHEAEAFFILDGTMSYQAGNTLYRLSAGYFIYLPQGVPHAFRVTGTSPVRFLGLAVPAGLMDMYDEVGMPAIERRLPGLDEPPVEEEIRRWNEVSPGTGYALSGHPFRARPDGSAPKPKERATCLARWRVDPAAR
jgi:mannose-6-phosphate isomerase-like protein (cupin superfamily)